MDIQRILFSVSFLLAASLQAQDRADLLRPIVIPQFNNTPPSSVADPADEDVIFRTVHAESTRVVTLTHTSQPLPPPSSPTWISRLPDSGDEVHAAAPPPELPTSFIELYGTAYPGGISELSWAIESERFSALVNFDLSLFTNAPAFRKNGTIYNFLPIITRSVQELGTYQYPPELIAQIQSQFHKSLIIVGEKEPTESQLLPIIGLLEVATDQLESLRGAQTARDLHSERIKRENEADPPELRPINVIFWQK